MSVICSQSEGLFGPVSVPNIPSKYSGLWKENNKNKNKVNNLNAINIQSIVNSHLTE